MNTTQQLRVLTLNCWGLPDIITKVVYRKYKDPKVSKGRKWPSRTERFAAIANKLDAFDIVCLQEVWIKEDQELLRTICKDKGLQYSHVFSSGLIGSSGLQIISRYPIKEVFFHQYRVNGAVYRVDHGDYHAGKGFGFARVQINDLQSVSVIVTHTIARYKDDDSYHADRLSQVWELIRFLQLTSRPNQPVIVAGDMNSRPNSVEYSMFTQVGKLFDAYGEYTSMHPSSEINAHSTSMGENPQRIDYIFFNKMSNWKLTDSRVVLNDNEFLYSDHFGVSATFTCLEGQLDQHRHKERVSLVASAHTVEDDSETFAGEPNYRRAKDVLEECSSIIVKGTSSAVARKTNHLLRSLTILLLVWVLVSFGAPSQYIIALITYVIAEFLIALFPVENEISALREVHKEIKYFS